MSDLPRIFHVIVSILTLVIGSVGNVLLLVIISSRRCLGVKNSVHDTLITNLAVADFLWVVLSTPTYVFDYFGAIDYSMFYCKVVWPVMTMAFNVDIFTVTVMAIHRCQAISNPWKPRIRRTSAVLWALGTWAISLIVTLPVFVVTIPREGACHEDWPSANYRGAYTAVLFALQYVIPLVVIAASYTSMAVHLRRLKYPAHVNASTTTRRRTRQENVDAIKVLAVIVIAFATFMLPAQVVWMLYDFGGNASEKSWFSPLYYFSDLLAIFHSCLNPLIYGFLNKKYRREYMVYFSHMCCGCCPCRRRNGRSRNASNISAATTGAINNVEVLYDHQANVVLRSHKTHCSREDFL